MRRLFFFAALFLMLPASAQRITLTLATDTPDEQRTLDSISYRKQHPDLRSVNRELETVSEQLTRAGFIENEIASRTRPTDSAVSAVFRLGPRTKALIIYIGAAERETLRDILPLIAKETVPFAESENRLTQWLAAFERNGYPLARLQLRDFRREGSALAADLWIDRGDRRSVNAIVVNGYDQFPAGHKASVERTFRDRPLTRDNLAALKTEFDKFRFVTQTRYPEILFAKDTTKVYVYVEKAKANRFEGFLGFSNDEERNVRFNGYLDLQLTNLLNSGEEFALYWKSDGNQQRTFNASLELPYIFRSRLGLRMSLNIFRQDSTFQTTKTSLEAGYLFRHNLRGYLGYQSAESSDIQNQNTSTLSDFNNRFLTASFEFLDLRTSDFLFPERTRVQLKAGTGSRASKTATEGQYFVTLDAFHSFYLNEKNSLFIRTQDYFLQSGNYILNELYRFGGINSIRGFNENSLQGQLFTSILSEYRYTVGSSLYLHSVLDYGYYRDETSGNNGKLLGIGLGAGILTRNGLLRITYANGTANGQQIRLSNSIVHISFKTIF
ncbi:MULTISPECIES: hypothetical protein [unclassified Flavobacterium]|uniref:hypothetical protein n=1 Tax=unclassified Flavobacterium TaxID=196869 RepID=UPI001F13FE32|nr:MULTISPECIES: hypothetical protein [unclassified Flavobacterium]UMY66970.1 hypothetical protein MKO97_06205 [Flavobacterium sp. HJ-32-4]